MSITLNVRHNAGGLAGELSSLPPRLDGAMREGTRSGVRLMGQGLEALVVRRTSMNAGVASRITRTDFRPLPNGGTGTVGFRPPPAGGWEIRAKGKALAFGWPKRGPGPGRGGKWLFQKVQHPGSRPYGLVSRSALADEEAVRRAYREEVGRIL